MFDRDEILAGDAASPRVTDHDLDVRAALQIADLVGGAPRIVCLVGVVPHVGLFAVRRMPSAGQAAERLIQRAHQRSPVVAATA